ncbi:MAG TPA: aldehyde dehydrogenase family protein [Microbacterium sp.]|uniref:aldehyde dehydrogenase family protein n=1 Tax=Microbacterium sp. TaxID=51671 RepID=UPI002CD15F58|nr:aldehyde dehydrogenase family protein [Microbacterium sp.]HWI31285.1 aldehyde dehydrogenase family protein [Microbacterium sp.]
MSASAQSVRSSDITTVSPDRDELLALLALQRAAFHAEGPPTVATRRNRIDRLMLSLLEHSDELTAAIDADFGRRPSAFSLAVDVLGSLADAAEISAGLDDWVKDQPLESGGFIQQHPLGVVAVIGAWNFPVTLTVQPAVAALAAGNRVVLKMPSTSPRTAEVLRRAIAENFAQDEVAVVTGDGQVNDDFVALPFDHIMFTGSPRVGSIVQQAAGKNLVPVTLELGGKNPVVVSAHADIDVAADRVALSRMANGGQVCLCADYVLVHESVKDRFVETLVDKLFGYFPHYIDNPDVVSLVNDAAYERIIGLIDDAVHRGATRIDIVNPRERGLLPDPAGRLIPPTLLLDVPDDALINQDEIFGPVLPISTFRDVDDAIEAVYANPAPLAAYWYGPDDEDFQRFCSRTTSGGVTRNDGFAHAGAHGAPFGGVGQSGHGAYHGKFGFDTFTHRRPIVANDGSVSAIGPLVGTGLNSPDLQRGLTETLAAARSAHRQRVADYAEAST